MMTIQERFDAFSRTHVLVIGDVMLDTYVWGTVDRISPESPVPVLEVTREEHRPGGAANVALNLRSLGASVTICGLMGDDMAAAELSIQLQDNGINAAGMMVVAGRPTTQKTRVIGRTQQMLRIDREDRKGLSEPDKAQLLLRIHTMIDQLPDVIILQDYDKGTLSPEVIQSIIDRAGKAGIPVATDPKRNHFLDYTGCTLFKPNLKELREGLALAQQPATLPDIEAAISKLRHEMPHAITFITLSEKGVYITDGQEAFQHDAHRRQVADVSGAGDTVISVAALLLAQKAPLSLLAALSNLAGGLVCEEVGVVPVNRDRLWRECERLLQ